MELSPNDIRSYEFPTQLRGYEKDSVDSFLDQAADTLEELKQVNLKLSMELDSVRNQLNGLRQFEDTIKNAAIDARRNADMTMENAKKEGKIILQNAKTNAEKTIKQNEQKMQEIENQISQLDLTRRSYMTKLKALIQSHLDIVDEIDQAEIPEHVKKEIASHTESVSQTDSIEVTDSSEVDNKTRETISTPPSNIEGSKTEEATVDEQIKDADKSPQEASKDTADVDPELAEAIKGFRSNDDPEVEPSESQPEPSTTENIDPSTGWVETDRRAEEIPPEFIVNSDSSDKSDNSTDKVIIDEQKQQASPQNNGADDSHPEDISNELDRVAAKFEEEMNKADKQ